MKQETAITKVALGVIVALALTWRLVVLKYSLVSFYSDDAIYAAIARFWIEGKFNLVFHPTWPPLFPALSATVFLVVRNWETALRLVSILSGSFIAVPLFFLAKKFLPTLPAYLFVISTVFTSPFLKISLVPQSDMLATFILITALAFMLYGIADQKNQYFLFSAFTLGLLYLTRSEGLLFFLLSFFYLALWSIIQVITRQKRLNTLLILPAFLIIFTATISPYWIALKTQTGRWDLSAKSSAQAKQWHAMALNKQGTTWSQEVVSVKHPNYKSGYFQGGLIYILEYQDWFWFWFKQKAVRWKGVFAATFPSWSIPIIITGLLPLGKRKTFWSYGLFPYLGLTAIPLTIFATPISDVRYLAWTIPLFLLLFYSGLKTLASLLKTKVSSPAWILLMVVILFGFPTYSLKSAIQPIVYAKDFTNGNYRQEIKEAGAWIRQNATTEEPKIMMRHEGVEFYANGATIYIPQDLSLEETLKYGEKYRADYFVAWTEELIADKNLAVLLNPRFHYPGIKNVFQFPKDSPKIIVWGF